MPDTALHPSRGILAMLAAVAAFAVMDATMKSLAQTYPPFEISCLRGLASIPFFLLGVGIAKEWHKLLPTRWVSHIVRGLLAIVMLSTFIYAVKRIPLGTAYGIVLCAPLLITALSALVLHEHVGPHRWSAIVVGLIGVGIILNPSGHGVMTLAGVAALTCALAYACAATLVRRLTHSDSTFSIGLSFMVVVAIGSGILSIGHWVPILSAHWPWFLLLGFSGALGQYFFIIAFRSAPVSVIAPFEYTALLWGMGIDWIVWSTLPNGRMLCGGAVVIASGLYVIHREHGILRLWKSTTPTRQNIPLP